MPTLRINTANYYYECYGSGDPIVLINGLVADHTGWFPILDILTTSHTVLIFDDIGTGQTTDDGSDFDVDRMADDTIALATKLGLKKPHIVGHSLGGAVALSIAHRYPDAISSIALCNTFIQLNDKIKPVFSNALKLYQSGELPSRIVSSLLPFLFSDTFMNPAIRQMILKACDDNLHPQTVHGYERQLRALYSFNASSWIDQVKMLALIISSDQDKVATVSESKEIAKHLHGSKLVTLSSGHASMVEAPLEFVAELISFYRELKRILNLSSQLK